ncbi:MAG: hypothetical protein EOM68_21760 [Spirochaetia bacterium]|nr:hypothetical protein [Spirochaetia bacterium]
MVDAHALVILYRLWSQGASWHGWPRGREEVALAAPSWAADEATAAQLGAPSTALTSIPSRATAAAEAPVPAAGGGH